ncbi:sulfatase [Maricurvus nonylphenolicus]|uniref:sulfatase family protein n=1 Tax=Maricurvus nonylphenolicus TaxID=1008307 RepID=UPI0036F33FED
MIKKHGKLLAPFTALLLGLSSTNAIGNKPQIESNEVDTRPNIVVIFADDMGYGDVSSYGATDIATPNLDALAQGGIRFTDSYAISPICSPSRAGLLTGRYPVRMGIHEVFMPQSYTGLPPKEITLAEMLGDAGYNTAMFGKWHLGHHEKFMPNAQGFEYFYGYPYSNDITPFYAFENTDIIEWEVDQTQITRQLTERSIRYIEQQGNAPFFIYIAHPMPHIPLYNSEAFTGSSQRGQYGDVIQELDWSVGQIKAALEQQGLLDNTLIMFASDNGPWLLAEEDGGSAGPLRAGKGSTFEGGMRIPTIAHWPKGLPQGLSYTGLSSMLDWFPTMAAMAGVTLDRGQVIDGENILPLIQAPEPRTPERQLVYYNNGEIEAFRKGNWKLKLPNVQPKPWIARKLMSGEDDILTDIELYNLSKDIGEQHNLAQQFPEKVAELQQAITHFKQSLGPVPAGLDIGLRFQLPDLAQYPLRTLKPFIIIGLLLITSMFIAIGYWWGRRRNSQ